MQNAADAVEGAIRAALTRGATREEAIEAGRKVAEEYKASDLQVADIILDFEQLMRRR